MSGYLFLSAFLVAVTVIGAAFLQSKKVLNKPYFPDGLIGKNYYQCSQGGQMAGDYVPIRE